MGYENQMLIWQSPVLAFLQNTFLEPRSASSIKHALSFDDSRLGCTEQVAQELTWLEVYWDQDDAAKFRSKRHRLRSDWQYRL